MIKRIGLLCFVITLALQVSGRSINTEEARQVAQAAMHSNLSITNPVDFSMVTPSDVLEIEAGSSRIFAVNFNRGGFVLVAGTDAAVPVLGYSFTSRFSGESMPPALEAWLQGYKSQLNDLVERNIQPTAAIKQKWTDLQNYNPELNNGPRSTTEVTPLLTSTWDQGARYNDLCPEAVGGPGGRVWSGCVATAMSQVINYWRYPLQGIGSHGYTSDYGYLFVDFAQANYDYNQMNNNIGGESNYEMAEIQYHCGVAVDMMYSPNGSGAYSWDAADALRNNFGYSSDLALELKEDYSDSEWANLLMANLDNSWPMYYHGFGSGGHAFNVDGYQGTDYFHFNWGWSGSYNAYFYLNNLNPGGSNFSEGQGAIVNFHPGSNYPYYCNGLTTLTRHNGMLEDGSGPVDPYSSGLSCGWLIAPEDSITGLTLVFERFDVTSGIDALNVYDGPDAGFPLLGSYTGSAMPPSLTASGDKMYIEFLTSGNQGSGWKASYSSDVVSYCSGLTTLNAAEGTISDGSAGRPYHNNSVCKYKIEPEGASSILISFNALNTEPTNDVVKVFDYVTQALIGVYSGSEIPEDIVVPSAKAYILFFTDDNVQGEGFELTYTGITTGIEQPEAGHTGNLNLRCYPNPVNDWLRIEIGSSEEVIVGLSLIASDGRAVREVENYTVSKSGSAFMDMAGISNGLYFLKYTSTSGSGMKKIIVNK